MRAVPMAARQRARWCADQVSVYVARTQDQLTRASYWRMPYPVEARDYSVSIHWRTP